MRTRIGLSLLVLAFVLFGQDDRFVAIDVYVDAGESGLAAWQVEVDAGEGASIVGVEGGEDGPYAEPAYYDPAALKEGGRIVLAAFTTEANPPSGRVRVARLHFHETGAAPVTYRAEAVVAAAPGGKKIPIEVELVPLEKKR